MRRDRPAPDLRLYIALAIAGAFAAASALGFVLALVLGGAISI